MKRLGFNLTLMGAFASGKDTQAEILEKKYSLYPVKTGVYTRNLMKEKSKNGEWTRRTAGKGKPLPTTLMKQFLLREIKNKPKNKDLIFVGGPRLKPESQLTKKILNSKNMDFFALYITLPKKEIYKRSLARSIGNMEGIYKIFDTKELIKKRIKEHEKPISETVKFLQQNECLKKINGNQSIKKVAKDIEKAIMEHQKMIG